VPAEGLGFIVLGCLNSAALLRVKGRRLDEDAVGGWGGEGFDGGGHGSEVLKSGAGKEVFKN